MDTNEFITLPQTEDELLTLYFDKEKNEELAKRIDFLNQILKYPQTQESVVKRYSQPLTVCELKNEQLMLKKIRFQAALSGFAACVCELQKEVCVQQYWNTSNIKEPDFISDARMPELITDPRQYEKMIAWWLSLNLDTMTKVATHCVDAFGKEWKEEDDRDTQDNIVKRWQSLPLETRKQIFIFYNPEK